MKGAEGILKLWIVWGRFSWSNAAAHHLAWQSRILRSTVGAALQESLHERRVSGN